MIKQIAMSATYRQSSQGTPERYGRDPQNRLLAHGARFRLQSEFIRDNVLALSGLLVDKMGGPGVKPYQPPGLWKEVGLGGKPEFKQDHKESLYRRSLYTYWKRSAPPPNMQLFDAPTHYESSRRTPDTSDPPTVSFNRSRLPGSRSSGFLVGHLLDFTGGRRCV